MNDSTSNQLNESYLNYSSERNQADETRCVMDKQFVPKVGMIFKTLEDARKFYKNYSKLACFSTKTRNTTRKGDEIKNQLIVCSREGVEIQDISYSEDKFLSRHKLSSDLCTHIEGRRSLDNFQSRSESLTPLLFRPDRDA
ncbi:hypothetical protein Ahy_A03g010104 [Arachis hypogaea]|uniref:FAR1 domain-containing protein n=1 Tax=Arachis hypogaea TaxID=3818 RepID=A0A445DL65_ARAHY|nr:hypothetical protein Ahy_A03g010104 [Arachis hypogaea]